MDLHPPARAAAAALRLGHLRGGRQHAGRTHATVARIVRETGLVPAAHLTCVGASRDEVDEVARQYWEAGIRHIVALRGDPPPGRPIRRIPEAMPFATDLVGGAAARRGLRDLRGGLSGDASPAALSPDADLDNLKRKLDAGATRAITNFFFDTEVYLRFLDRCLAAGITAPIVPGIMAVTNFAGLIRMSAMCGASVPAWLGHLFEGMEDDPEIRRMVAAVVAAEQVRLLQANGVDEFHFYTLNRPDLTFAIAHILGVRPMPGRDDRAARPRPYPAGRAACRTGSILIVIGGRADRRARSRRQFVADRQGPHRWCSR